MGASDRNRGRSPGESDHIPTRISGSSAFSGTTTPDGSAMPDGDADASTVRGSPSLDDQTPFAPAAPRHSPFVPPAARPTQVVGSTPPVRHGTAADETLPPGANLGDYVIEHKLGSGAMGDVYLGVHRVIRKRAAIKVLRGEAGRDASLVERFITEARVVNEIGHPNIVDVFAFGQTPDGRQFLAMECLEGETLGARVARGPLSLRDTIAIARPLVDALLAVHGKGVIHRDLKPENVFLHSIRGAAPTVKLLDFGIAKLERSDRALVTDRGVTVGTPIYMPPEQAQGLTVDSRSDTYALGGMLFEMVTGRPPFLANSIFEILSMHINDTPPRASALAKIPPELDDLIDAMLAKDPNRRPPLTEVLRTLDVLDGASRHLSSSSVQGQESTLQVRSRRVGPVLAALLVLGGAAVAAGIYRMVSAQRTNTPSARSELVVPPPVVDASPSLTPAAPPPADASVPMDAMSADVATGSASEPAAIATPAAAPAKKAPPTHRKKRTRKKSGRGSSTKPPCDPYSSIEGC